MLQRWAAAVFVHGYVPVFILAFAYLIMLVMQPSFTPQPLQFGSSWIKGHKATRSHPIDHLIQDAKVAFHTAIAKNPRTLLEAAHSYRQRRHRHPPPGFDEWYAAARKAKALIPESFFDRIYKDLEPFWSIDAKLLRFQSYSFPHVIRVRDGKVYYFSEPSDKTDWIELWADSLKEFAEFLPDVDIPVNVMEHPRLAVPWESLQKILADVRRKDAGVQSPRDVITAYTGVDAPPVSPTALKKEQIYTHNWATPESGNELGSDIKLYWLHYQKTCPPDTPGRDADAFDNGDSIQYPHEPNKNYTQGGYISDVNAARDPCVQPLMRAMHGVLFRPVGLSTSGDLMPVFAGSKLPGNNEILWPGATYYARNKDTVVKDTRWTEWSSKKDKLFWQGPATGGVNEEMTWWRFHRHRFAQMTNGTTVDASVNMYKIDAPSFNLPNMLEFAKLYPEFTEHHPGTPKAWLKSSTDVRITDLICTPEHRDASGRRLPTCPYSGRLISVQDAIPPAEWYDNKIVADIDGNTYSPYFASMVASTSMPIKATMFAEWHDDRLFPWFHYVPMDNSFIDLYGLMDYFLKDEKDRWLDHDDAAETIARNGVKWSKRMLRDDDMQLYTWRLLLEYARVCDPLRYKIGYVDDLVDRGKKNYNE
ncbi:hypothetical protein SCUCBS95973_002402 [Sporothrix curviconia]|uniref:Glycosyl transferase CAP10 domain-containing protein n=1 Tax=Sporothrix curviconia TaxID=1260050 RepID=A0ABP0B6I4_9PEZI